MNTGSSGSSSPATRPSLLQRLHDRTDHLGWEEFHRLYRRLIYGAAARAGLPHADSEDVVQEVIGHVVEKISEYQVKSSPGSFRRWLLNHTRWRVTDRFRQRQRTVELPLSLDAKTGASLVDRAQLDRQEKGQHEQVWEGEWQQHLLKTALARLAKKAPGKQFQAFELFSTKGWPVARVAEELGMNPAAVYVCNHRLTRQLQAEVERLRGTLL